MHFPLAHTDNRQRHIAIALVLCIHVVLLGAMYFSSPRPEQVAEGRRMLFMFVEPKKPAAAQAPRKSPAPAPMQPVAQPVAAATPAPVTPMQQAPADAAPAPPAATAPDPAPGAEDMLRQARSDIGGIDRAMRSQIPKGLVRAPVMTPYKRFVKGVEEAAELAPPKWYEAPKIKEIVDPGGWGKKRYRVITANGTYCLTYSPNRNMAGNDVFNRSPTTVPTNCDADEQPPTVQP